MNSVAIINIAKKELGLCDDDYRDILDRVTGKRSLKEMTEAEKRAVVDDFKSRGFVVKSGRSKGKSGISAKRFVRQIYALWKSCAELGVIENGKKAALRTFVAQKTEAKGKRVDDPDFLTYDQAAPIIETLKAMERRGKKTGGKV